MLTARLPGLYRRARLNLQYHAVLDEIDKCHSAILAGRRAQDRLPELFAQLDDVAAELGLQPRAPRRLYIVQEPANDGEAA